MPSGDGMCKGNEVRMAHSGKLNKVSVALTGVAPWVGHHPANQKVTGSIPSQGTCLG